MRKVELIPGVHSSILGFGCAPILGSVGASQARRALDCALDCGINHFDLARSYGYGEAEAFVGRTLRSKRGQVVLASKFGIKANWKSRLLIPAKPLVRWFRGKNKPRDRASITTVRMSSAQTDSFHDRLPMRANVMQKSVETSLRALKTDYLDILFIHDPQQSLTYIEELTEAASKLKKGGKIRGLGLAFYWENKPLHHDYINQFDVLQCNNSPGCVHYEEVQIKYADKRNLFFSPFSSNYGNMHARERLQKLYKDFPTSIVLCSMFQVKHIQQNCEVANHS